MIAAFLANILAAVIALLPIANPASTSVLFLGLTKGQTHAERENQARRACLYMAGILVTFLVAGTLIMAVFGISLPGIRIAGGIMIAVIGFRMLSPAEEYPMSAEIRHEARQRSDIAFMPIAMPSLSGPGAIAVTIGLAAQAPSWTAYFGIAVGIGIVAVICYLALRAAGRFVDFLGATGLDALSRIMGFLLLCIGVQFIVTGLYGVVTEPGFLKSLTAAWDAAST